MNNNHTSQSSLGRLLPIMLCFFASNYVKADLQLSDSEANIFPSLVFFWFLIFSVPTGMLMNRIGRKKTVMLSLIVTFASLLLPIFGDSYLLMLVSFSLLGIGNALMQTSLNPLLSNIVSGDRLASSLTFGQFVIHRHVGRYAGYPFFRIAMESTFPHLHGNSYHRYLMAGSHFYP